jgi:hypothetical protein
MKSHQTTKKKKTKTKPLIAVGTHIVKANANKPNIFAHRNAIKPHSPQSPCMNVHAAVVNIYTQWIERHITLFIYLFLIK